MLLKLPPIFNAVAACPDIIAILLFIVQLYLIPSFEAARSAALCVLALDTASGNSASWGYHEGVFCIDVYLHTYLNHLCQPESAGSYLGIERPSCKRPGYMCTSPSKSPFIPCHSTLHPKVSSPCPSQDMGREGVQASPRCSGSVPCTAGRPFRLG